MHRYHRSHQHPFLMVQLLLIAALLGVVSVASAQEGDTNNAATWYQRAWEKQWNITADEFMAVEAYRAQGGKPSAEVREIMRRMAPMLADIRRATNLGFADFEVLPGTPEGERVNQSSKLRGLIKWMDADAKMRVADGDAIGAATQMASMYKLLSHAGDDHSLSSSLVSAAMAKFTESTLDYAMEDHSLGPAELATVLNSMNALDPRDPFQFVNGLTWQQMEIEQLVQDAQQPGAQVSAIDLLTQIGFPPEYVPGLDQLSEAEMYGQVSMYHDLLGTFIKIEDSDDPEWVAQQLEQLQAAADKGELGPVGEEALKMLLRSHDSNVKMKASLEAREAQLAGLVQGKVDPSELMNAAVFYRTGIDHLDSLDAVWVAAIESMMNANVAPTPETLASLKDADRAAVDQAIAEFTKGSLIRRCDFSTRRLEDEFFIPAYSNGMRRGFALLCIEAVRLDVAGQRDDALAQLATCFRMIGHLGGDGLILSAMDAQDGFTLARAMAQRLIDAEKTPVDAREEKKIDPARLAELAAAIRRTGPRDPFGYAAASRVIDEKATQHLKWMISGAFGEYQPDAAISPEHLAADQRATRWIATLDTAGKWYVYGVESLKEGWHDESKPRLRARTQSSARPVMSSILDLAEVDAPALRQKCRTEQLMTLDIPPVDGLLDLTQRAARAAADQRDGVRLAASLTELSRANSDVPTRMAMNSIEEMASTAIDGATEVGQ